MSRLRAGCGQAIAQPVLPAHLGKEGKVCSQKAPSDRTQSLRKEGCCFQKKGILFVCLDTTCFSCMFYSLILFPQSKAHFIEEEDEEQNKLPKVTQSYIESEARFWSSLDSKA